MIHDSLLTMLPGINRAREYYLYDRNGTRYLDFYQNRGRALLGHRPDGVSALLKSEISKGVYSELPSREEEWAARELKRFFGGYVSIFRNIESAMLKCTGGKVPKDLLTDPGNPGAEAVLWRPFFGTGTETARYVFPVLPFPGAWFPQPVISADSPPPPGDAVSPIQLRLIIKILDLLKNALDREKELSVWWKRFDAPCWKRRGPYLIYRGKNEYKKMFSCFLENGILLNPREEASIIPGKCSEGDLDKFGRLCVETD
ncbi:MAG: hypothetical protein ACLFST_00190 [Spirochaetia bacterium]